MPELPERHIKIVFEDRGRGCLNPMLLKYHFKKLLYAKIFINFSSKYLYLNLFLFLVNAFNSCLYKSMKKLDLEKSTTHLLDVNYKEFLALCPLHQGIVTCFGSSQSCTSRAAMCTHGCKKHTKNMCKHKYIEVEQLVAMIEKVRKGYRQFHSLFVNEMIPNYVEKIKQIFKQLVRELLKIDENTLLIEQFFSVAPNQQIQTIMTENIKNWEINQLNCMDIRSLQVAYSQVMKTTRLSSMMKIQNLLDNNFLKILATKNIIPYQPKKIYEIKPSLLLQLTNLENGKDRLKELQNLYIGDSQKQLLSLSIKLQKLRARKSTNELLELIEKNCEDNKQTEKSREEVEKLIYQARIQQQQQPIEDFMEQVASLVQKSKVQIIHFTMAHQHPEIEELFWSRLYERFGGKRVGMLQYIIIIVEKEKKEQLKRLLEHLDIIGIDNREDQTSIIIEGNDFNSRII